MYVCVAFCSKLSQVGWSSQEIIFWDDCRRFCLGSPLRSQQYQSTAVRCQTVKCKWCYWHSRTADLLCCCCCYCCCSTLSACVQDVETCWWHQSFVDVVASTPSDDAVLPVPRAASVSVLSTFNTTQCLSLYMCFSLLPAIFRIILTEATRRLTPCCFVESQYLHPQGGCEWAAITYFMVDKVHHFLTISYRSVYSFISHFQTGAKCAKKLENHEIWD